MINALVAINSNQVDSFFDNWRFDEEGNRLVTDFAEFNSGGEGSPTIDVYNVSHCVVPSTSQGSWRENTSGAQNKQLVTIYVADFAEPDWSDPNDPDPKTVLTIVNYLRETFSGAIQVLDCFQTNGVRHGQTLIPATYDENGDELTPESIEGNPTYQPNPQADMLLYMPDDVVYDEEGNEVSRTPATELTDVINVLGRADRKWL